MRLDEFAKFMEEHGDEVTKKNIAKETKEAEELQKKKRRI